MTYIVPAIGVVVALSALAWLLTWRKLVRARRRIAHLEDLDRHEDLVR